MTTKGIITVLLIAGSLLLFLGCEEDTQTPNGLKGWDYNYIVVAGLSSLHLLDINSNSVIPGVAGLGLGANWIARSGYNIYVINSLSNNLQIFEFSPDSDSIELTSTVDLGLQQNNNPYSATISGNRMYVTNLMQNSLSILDLTTLDIDTTLPAGGAPEGVTVGEGHLFVINSGYDFSAGLNGHNLGSIYKYEHYTTELPDTFNGELLDSLQLGMNPQFVEYCDEDHTLHVTCTGDYSENTGEIWVLDTDLNVLNIIPVDGYPGKIKFDGSDFYIACGGWLSDGDEKGLAISYNWQTPGDMKYIYTDLGVMDMTTDERNISALYTACYDELSICVIEGDTLQARFQMVEPPVAVCQLYDMVW